MQIPSVFDLKSKISPIGILCQPTSSLRASFFDEQNWHTGRALALSQCNHQLHSPFPFSGINLHRLQALGFQISWSTIFQFRAQRSWKPISNYFFSSVKIYGNPFSITMMVISGLQAAISDLFFYSHATRRLKLLFYKM